ncbi:MULTISPECIES: hypothetical protein [Paenibacillus]|uniref:hypothetical protein n=1 Tax=Paenibacillus TaxID=44249 RepID=UPI000838315A|nr:MULTISPECIES: hypothetical protein [Paenibacillus]GIP24442.1 hypothetical protein J22TS3_47170 [Paenibacillus sp. J22TS3]
MNPNLSSRLLEWNGRPIEVRISDRLGLDPVAPPQSYQLVRTEMEQEGNYIRFYISDWQFVAVPVFPDSTLLTEEDGQAVFTSTDAEGKLVYSVKCL